MKYIFLLVLILASCAPKSEQVFENCVELTAALALVDGDRMTILTDKLPAGTRMSFTGTRVYRESNPSSGWTEVVYEGQLGWVRSEYVKSCQ